MKVDKALAQRIEHAIMLGHLAFTTQYKNTEPKSCSLEIGRGAACYTGHDSFFSQVVGWGFDDSEIDFSQQLQIIEKFYIGNNMNTIAIELCPAVGSGVFNILREHQYYVTEASNISVLSLNEYQPIQTGPSVNLAKEDMFRNLGRLLATAFGVPGAENYFYQYCATPGIYPFVAEHDNQLAAAGTVAIFDAIVDLGVTATLEAYRGLGLQKALLHARLQYAKLKGATIAVVTTEPGSISDDNVQKLGFQVAYTRIKFEKDV